MLANKAVGLWPFLGCSYYHHLLPTITTTGTAKIGSGTVEVSGP